MTQQTIWSNASFPAEIMKSLNAALASYRVIRPASLQTLNLVAAPPDPNFMEAEIGFGQPDPDQIIASTRIRWVHLTSAGYTRYDRKDLRTSLQSRGVVLTNSSHVYDEPCAQHVLAMIMSMTRQLPQALEDQIAGRSWPSARLRENSRLLIGERVLIYGFGTIARRLVELLAPLKMEIIGIRRHPTGDEPVKVLPQSDADTLLPTADHIINILPANDATTNYFDANRFVRMQPGTLFYNIGRGTTVDQAALLASLQSKRLAGAYLDVTEPEPLPPDHPLWSAPNCYITPHTAGGHNTEFTRLTAHFLENLRRYQQKQPLIDRVM